MAFGICVYRQTDESMVEHPPEDVNSAAFGTWESLCLERILYDNPLGSDDAHRAGSDETILVYQNAINLPLKKYSEVYNPLPIPPEKPVVSDVADDITHIYWDVTTGLQFYEAGSAQVEKRSFEHSE